MNMIDNAEAPDGVELYDWDNFPKHRQMIFDKAKGALESQFPQTYGGVRVELHDTHYVDPEEYSIAEQKSALMGNKFLHRRLRGTFKLFDEKNNIQIDELPNTTLMRVPYLTERGTFISGGNELTHIAQSRLRSGVYTRRKDTGEVEAHFNSKRGTGRAFRIHMDPESGVMKLDVGQSSLRLYSLLKDIGVPDDKIEKSWGPELLAKNRDAYDARVFDKAYQRLAKRPDPAKTRDEKAKEILEALSASKLERSVLERTLPNRLNKQAAVVSDPQAPAVQQQADQQQEQQEQGQDGFNKGDYLLLADFLNKQFHAGIPMDAPVSEIVQALIEDLKKIMPGVTPEGLTFALSQHANNSNDYDEEETS